MLITPENIEMWKKDPAKWDYDRGYNEASLDLWNQSDPIVFTNKHSKAFYRGYRQGWAEQRTHLEIDQIYHEEFNEELLGKLVNEKYNEVCILTMQIALVPDSDVPEYFKDDWKQVMHFLEHPEEIQPIKRIVAKNGQIVSKEGYDNG